MILQKILLHIKREHPSDVLSKFLQVGDIDAERNLVDIRMGKGHKDRLVPLPDLTLLELRELWKKHCYPKLLFPNAKGSLKIIQKNNFVFKPFLQVISNPFVKLILFSLSGTPFPRLSVSPSKFRNLQPLRPLFTFISQENIRKPVGFMLGEILSFYIFSSVSYGFFHMGIYCINNNRFPFII